MYNICVLNIKNKSILLNIFRRNQTNELDIYKHIDNFTKC